MNESIMILSYEARWAGACLVIVLLLRYHRLLNTIATFAPSRWIQTILGWLTIGLVSLALLDEGGLFLNELSMTTHETVFSTVRSLMAVPWIAKLLEFCNHLLVVLFVSETLNDIRIYVPLQARLNTIAATITILLLCDYAQVIVWKHPGTFSSSSVGFVMLFGIIVLYGICITLTTDAASKAFIASYNSEPNMLQERNRFLVDIARYCSIIFPLSETLVSRAFVLWFIYDRLSRLIKRLFSKAGTDIKHVHWYRLSSQVKPQDYWLIKGHFVLGMLSTVPLISFWRVMISNDPPLDSFYKYPVSVSLGLSIFIVFFVFIVKRGSFTSLSLIAAILAYCGSYIIFPHLFVQLFAPDVSTTQIRHNRLADASYDAGITVSLILILYFLNHLMSERSQNRFIFYGESWNRLIPKLIFQKFVDLCLFCGTGSLMLIYFVQVTMLDPIAEGHFALSMEFLLRLFPGIVILIFLPVALNVASRRDALRMCVRLLIRGYRSRLASGSASADALKRKFPWLVQEEEELIARAETLPELARLNLIYAVLGIGVHICATVCALLVISSRVAMLQ